MLFTPAPASPLPIFPPFSPLFFLSLPTPLLSINISRKWINIARARGFRVRTTKHSSIVVTGHLRSIIYLHSIGESEFRAPMGPAAAPTGLSYPGNHPLRWDLIMLRHRHASTNTNSSLTFVGSSENVGRDPGPSPARSRHYQTSLLLDRTTNITSSNNTYIDPRNVDSESSKAR